MGEILTPVTRDDEHFELTPNRIGYIYIHLCGMCHDSSCAYSLYVFKEKALDTLFVHCMDLPAFPRNCVIFRLSIIHFKRTIAQVSLLLHDALVRKTDADIAQCLF